MAVYTPAVLVSTTGLSSATLSAAKYSAPAGTTGIARTIQVNSITTGTTFSMSLGAMATTTTRIFDAYALTQSVAAIFNGWWVTAANSADAINLISNTGNSTQVIGHVSGYTYA